jgi:hypothetical protein
MKCCPLYFICTIPNSPVIQFMVHRVANFLLGLRNSPPKFSAYFLPLINVANYEQVWKSLPISKTCACNASDTFLISEFLFQQGLSCVALVPDARYLEEYCTSPASLAHADLEATHIKREKSIVGHACWTTPPFHCSMLTVRSRFIIIYSPTRLRDGTLKQADGPS